MSKEIVVNVANEQTRIAIVEDDTLAELYIENADHKRTIGNIYLGRIRKVMPSIQAAFVDIGQEQDAFLHFSDLSENVPYQLQFLQQNEPQVQVVDLPEDGDMKKGDPPSSKLRHGQSLLVQVTKEPIANKGSRITTDLSLAGRFLVLVPLQNYVAISRKIDDNKERRRLKALAGSLVPEGFGVIVRTVAEGRDAKSLDKDLKLLRERWRRVEKRLAGDPQPPLLVHEDVDMASSIIRDQFSEEYDRILVDHKALFHSIRSYVRAVAPSMVDRVELHDSNAPVFEAAGIQRGADRAFRDRVELPSGGYLFIERTEAMHVIDVNSGRSGRGLSQAENSLKVNLEAARVVAHQIRLRDLGGIIVVDFIDMYDEKDRKKIYDELKTCFKEDRAITKLLPMSDFGLVEITRQRLRPSITTTFSSASGGGASASDEEGGDQAALERHRRAADRFEQKAKKLEAKVADLQKALEEARDEAREPKREAQRLRFQVEQLRKEAEAARADAEKARQSGDAPEAVPSSDGAPPEARDSTPAMTQAPANVQPFAPDALVDRISAWVADHKDAHRTITVRVHPFTAAYLTKPVPSWPTQWFMDHMVRVHLVADADVAPNAFRVEQTDGGEVLTEDALT